jgi:hypothetical protein
MEPFVHLIGFGATVVPSAPYRIDRVADEPETVLLVATAERSGLVDVADVLRGGETGGLVEVRPGDERSRWRVQTEVFTCAWPYEFGLSSDPDGVSPFLLLGPGDAMLWVAGPVDLERASPIEKLADTDQTIRGVAEAEGASRIDLDYELEGEPWWQRRYVVEWGEGQALVLTGQAPVSHETVTREAVDAMDQTLQATAAARTVH